MERERQTKAAAFVHRVADQPDPFGALRARRPGRDAAADIEHLRAPDAHPRHRFEIAGDAVGGRIAVHPMPPGVRSRIDRGRFEAVRSEEHTSELQSLMRISYAVFCLKKHTIPTNYQLYTHNNTI